MEINNDRKIESDEDVRLDVELKTGAGILGKKVRPRPFRLQNIKRIVRY